MSYGKVCLASDINANKQALDNTGLFFKVNDTEHLTEMMCYVAARREQLKSLGEQAQQRIKDNFTWDIIADSYLNFCMSLTN
jgi:glycosyltransferase involved in cell wall biosynthesis